MVVGADGRQYGPVDLPNLKEWVRQGRVTWDCKVRNMHNGMMLKASNMPELDGMFAPTQGQFNAMVSGSVFGQSRDKDPYYEYKFILALSLAGIFASFLASFLAVIFPGYALYRACGAIKDQEKMSGVAFAIAILAVLASVSLPFFFDIYATKLIKEVLSG